MIPSWKIPAPSSVNEKEKKVAEIDPMDLWFYPKSDDIPENTVRDLQNLLRDYFGELGCSCEFISFDE